MPPPPQWPRGDWGWAVGQIRDTIHGEAGAGAGQSRDTTYRSACPHPMDTMLQPASAMWVRHGSQPPMGASSHGGRWGTSLFQSRAGPLVLYNMLYIATHT